MLAIDTSVAERQLGHIFSRIDHSRTADEVASQIEALILEGVLRAGDRLPAERELSRQLDISRPILRDALKALEARGLLLTRHGGGTHVADVIGQVFAPPMAALIATHPKATADYLEYRRDVEGIAAEYAASRATEDDRALLARIMARMERAYAHDDFDDEAKVDVEFHNAIVECAHNIILLHTLRSCYRLLSDGVFYNRSLIYVLAEARAKLLDQHKTIADAVMRGDPAAARAAAIHHIDYVESAVGEVERTREWKRVSRLRLQQRTDEPPAVRQ